jgi:NAD-dependent SIR2 family protein deacetylase
MKNLSELIEHLKKHKDAVIIIGNEVNQLKKEYSIDDFNNTYNRKNLRRSPDKLWDFYNKNILTDIDFNNVYMLAENIDSSLIINQNINSPIKEKAINIHGNVDSYICTKCKTIYTSNFIYEGDTETHECELCGGTVRPSVLLTGEHYDQAMFDVLKSKLIETHSLILIGMDYTEQPLLDLIADYGDIKSQVNAAGDPDNQKTLVVIQSKEQEFDPNQITFCDFLVKDDIEEAMKRLLKEY